MKDLLEKQKSQMTQFPADRTGRGLVPVGRLASRSPSVAVQKLIPRGDLESTVAGDWDSERQGAKPKLD